MSEAIDILAFGPHPDDVELCAGGYVLKARAQGKSVVVIDMTRGEAGTRGTPETREQESAAASKLMGLHARENLGLPDARVQVDLESLEKVTSAIRRWRPKIVLSPCLQDRHPDHIACAELIRRAYYGATIEKGLGNEHPPHRPDVLIQYFGHLEPTPSFVVDISDFWEARLELAKCYFSQLDVNEDLPRTNIASPDFMHRVEARYAYWGAKIGAKYGEPFLIDRTIALDDPIDTFRKRGWQVL